MRNVAWLGFVFIVLTGCVRTMPARGTTYLPARMPVRSFPSIWVSGGELEDETYLQDRLAAHLAADGTREVRRVDLKDLEPARKAGEIPDSTVVVLVDLETEQGERTEWENSPALVCSVYGCFNQFDTYTVEVPEVHGKAVVTVYEGPTARVLQRESFQRSVVGDDGHETANALVESLAKELERAVDVLRVREQVKLYRVDVPGVAAALERVRQKDWDGARFELEKAKDALGGQKKKVQARVWFDLGLARWFAPGKSGLTAEAHAEARRAFEQAIALDPHPLHKRVLERLDRARENYEQIERQRAATTANFALRAREEADADEAPEAKEAPEAND